MIEAVMCALIVALMGVGAGSAVAAAARGRDELRTRAEANAAADMLLAEICGRAFDDPETPDAVAGLDAGERHADRATLDDVDDYDALELAPVTLADGTVLTKALKVRVEVTSIDATDFGRSSGRTGLALVRVQVRDARRIVAERSAYRARHAEGGT